MSLFIEQRTQLHKSHLLLQKCSEIMTSIDDLFKVFQALLIVLKPKSNFNAWTEASSPKQQEEARNNPRPKFVSLLPQLRITSYKFQMKFISRQSSIGMARRMVKIMQR